MKRAKIAHVLTLMVLLCTACGGVTTLQPSAAPTRIPPTTPPVATLISPTIAVPSPFVSPIPTSIHPGNRTGIISGPLMDGDGVPFLYDAVIENFYREFANNFMFVVAAGVAQGYPREGFVGVASENHLIGFSQGAQGLRALNKTVTPTLHGSVHITHVNGPLVTLVAQDGAVFYFDYQTYIIT
jgi:hypothetical protein